VIPQAFLLGCFVGVSKCQREGEEIEAFIPLSACDEYFSFPRHLIEGEDVNK